MAYPLGTLADRVGAKALVMLGFLTYALVYLGFGLSSTGWQGILLFLLYALYSAAFEGSSRAYLAQVIPATEKASAIGLYHTLVGVLLFPASAIFGFLWQHFGSSVAFFTGAALALSALVLFWLDPTSKRSYTP
jgi:MFS family permease